MTPADRLGRWQVAHPPLTLKPRREDEVGMGSMSGTGSGPGSRPGRPPTAAELASLRDLVVTAERGVQAAYLRALQLVGEKDPLTFTLSRTRGEAAAAVTIVTRRRR